MRKQIGFVYQRFLKKQLFKKDPEEIHDKFTKIGKLLGNNPITKAITRIIFRYDHPMLKQNLFGINFDNPVGLSAGFDKDAENYNIMHDVGFGFMEIGSVTWNSYAGNPKPRLYRLPKSRGIVVYYGLKNIGARPIAEKLKKFKPDTFKFGMSIAKTNSMETCTVDYGIDDYFQSFKLFNEQNIGNFFTINISCPNTYGGEPFTEPENLDLLLQKLNTINTSKPVFVKMPINMNWNKFAKLLKVIVANEVDGVVIGNLNKDRDSIKEKYPQQMKGGISGKPTWRLSNKLIARTYETYGKKLKIIGVGGIFSAEDAYEKIRLGASLVELITGMIYEGPQLIGEINRGLTKLLKADGYKNISEAVGTKVLKTKKKKK